MTNCPELYEKVYAAAEGLQDEWEDRAVPSPSSIDYCARRLWYQHQGTPKTNRTPPRSIKRMESGRRIEPFWLKVYNRAGFIVVVLDAESRMPIHSLPAGGEFDALLIGNTTYPTEMLVLEQKDLGAWSFMRIVDEGVRAGAPDYYAQVQLYMEGLRQAGVAVERAVFHAGQADPSALVWLWQKIKKRAGRPPDFHVEVVPFDQAEVDRALARALVIQGYCQQAIVAPREYDPAEGKFPCGQADNPYCGWREQCLKDG